MADAIPLKVIDNGGGNGNLSQFAASDTVPITNGGTGASTATDAFAALATARVNNFAGLAGGTDVLPYQNGANTWAQTPLTAVGRALINASTQANALSYIGGVPKSLSSNRTVSDPNTVTDECGFYGIGIAPWSNLPPGIDSLNPVGSMLYHHPYDVSTAAQLFVPRTSNIFYFRRKVAGAWQPWVRVLSDAQIMGTVSVDGSGNPNGALFQNGSNANGEFVRFADGTQITRIRIIGSRATGTHSVSIAATFTSGQDTAVFVNWVPGTNWPVNPGNGIRGIYLQSASVVTFYLNDAMGANDSLVITAIGRWRA